MAKLPERKEVMRLRMLADDIHSHAQCLDQISGLLDALELSDEVACTKRSSAIDFIAAAIDRLGGAYKKVKKAEELERKANDDDAR